MKDMSKAGRLAFYAPMKAPDHPNPSGDRRIARLLIKALGRVGWDVHLASKLRTHQREGNPVAQVYLFEESERVAQRLIQEWREAPPVAWFTYHCYYKAPDLIGPTVARELGIPYLIAEGYRARKRLTGPYARYAKAAADALDHADVIFYLSERGLDALERDKPAAQRLIHLPPFTNLGEEPAEKSADGPLHLITVAMMRKGDKMESYRRLAAGLSGVKADWRLTVIGGGKAEADVHKLFADYGDRVDFAGLIDDADRIRDAYEDADLFLWPGVKEAFGLVYLEAQAAGTPCVAENHPGVNEVVGPMGRLAEPDDPASFAAAIDELAADRAALAAAGAEARAFTRERHGVNAAGAVIDAAIRSLL